MSQDRNAALQALLDRNYQDYLGQLRGKTFEELIKLAPEITAAQQLHEELPDICNDDDAKYLLQFDDPLEVMRGLWADALTSGRAEEISQLMWEIQDRESMEESVMVKQVSTDDLRHMEGQEGLVLQGCSGDPQEWVDGINDMLTEAGLLTQEQYQYFSSHLREDMPFIAANRNLSRRDENDATHCLLVTTRNIRGGILVDCQGSTYARYAAEVLDKSAMDLRGVPVDHYDLQLRQPPSEPER